MKYEALLTTNYNAAFYSSCKKKKRKKKKQSFIESIPSCANL